MKKLKKIPKFRSESAEKKFWQKNDTSGFVDCDSARKVSFPNLKPAVRSISLRLPESMLNDLKVIANKKDIPYQSLMKIFIYEKIKEEYLRSLIAEFMFFHLQPNAKRYFKNSKAVL